MNEIQSKTKPRQSQRLLDLSIPEVLIGGLLQIFDIPAISPIAKRIELSSNFYEHLSRTVAPDICQVEAVADVLEFFNWRYVTAVRLDDSYG